MSPWLVGPVALALGAGGLVLASRLATRWLAPGAPLALRWAARLAALHALAVVSFQALSAAHGLTVPVAVTLVGISVLGVSRHDGRLVPADLAADLEATLRRLVAALAGPDGTLVAAGLAILALGALRALLAPPLAWDALTYHLVLAALAVQGSDPASLLAPGSWSYYQEFPRGAEAFAAWAMLPGHGDLLVGLASFPAWLWLVASATALAGALRRPDATGPPPLAIGLAVGFLPAVTAHLTIAYVDLPALAGALFATALAVRALAADTGDEPLLAGPALAVVTVAKPTGLATATLAALPFLFRARPRTAALALTGFLLVAGPDLARSVARSGSPFHPAPVESMGRQLAAGHPAFRESFVESRRRAGEAYPTLASELPFWVGLAMPRLAVPGPLFPVAALVGLLALARLLRTGRHAEAGILVSAALAWLLPYLSPQARGYRLLWPELNSRYLVVPVALGLAWGAGSLPPALLRALVLLELWVGGFTLWPGPMRPLAPGPVVVLLVAGGVARWVAHRSSNGSRSGSGPRWALRWLVGGAVAAFLLMPRMLEPIRGRLRARAYREWQDLKALPAGLAGAFAAADREPGGVVAVTAGIEKDGQHWFWFPFFGARLQNRVVYVPIGKGPVPAGFAPLAPGEEPDRGRWLARLAEAGVERVAILPGETVEAGWVRELPERFAEVPGSQGRLWAVLGR